ncbi:REP15 protein, partial [Caloenas nicobarica]|nr:REP15 protein [Caloenas nicobarica]
MGQKVSHEDNQENEAETLVICEVFSQGVVHASQRLKDCLGFVDPQSKFQPATNTLSEIFLVNLSRLVGRDCLGLFIMFGVPGKPKDIRGVTLDSVAKEERKCRLSGRNALRQFVASTDSFLPAKDMLENFLGAKNGPKEVGNVYINFL